MSSQQSYNNSEASRIERMKIQRKRVSEQIAKTEKTGIFETTFFEELYKENLEYFRNKGYTIRNHGGPMNNRYSVIIWSESSN